MKLKKSLEKLENWIDVSVLDFTKKGGYYLKGIRTCNPCGGTSSPNVLSYTRCLKVWPGEPGVPKLLSHVSSTLKATPLRKYEEIHVIVSKYVT